MTIAKNKKNKKLLRVKLKVKQRFIFKALNPKAKPIGFNPQKKFN